MTSLSIGHLAYEGEAGYSIVPSSDVITFSDYIGPYYMREGATELRDGLSHMAFRVQEKHLNILSICHGGMIATFLDELMGFAAYMHASPNDVVTADLATRYIGSAALNDWVVGTAQILNASRSTIIVEGRLHVGDRLIAYASGTWRSLTPRNEAADQTARSP